MTGATPTGSGSQANAPSPSVSAVPVSIPSADRPYAGVMAEIMLAGEEDEGRRGVWPHHKRLPVWFIPADWSCWPVLSVDRERKELHIVAVASARKGVLRRLIDGAAKVGLSPVIVGPMGPVMPALMAKWGWKETIVGSGWNARDEWRPASAIEARRAATLGAVHESAVPPAADAQTPDLSPTKGQGL